jgi:carbon monoxide dehydrogenase subunit G
MARYRATVTTSADREAVFDYLADFRSASEWDPGVRSARLRAGSAGEEGAEYDLVAHFAGRDVPLVYRAVTVRRPDRVLLVAETGTVISRDEITFADAGTHGTEVTYDADLRLRGVLRVLDPLLGLVFGRVGDAARDGLAGRLAEPIRATPRQAA